VLPDDIHTLHKLQRSPSPLAFEFPPPFLHPHLLTDVFLRHQALVGLALAAAAALGARPEEQAEGHKEEPPGTLAGCGAVPPITAVAPPDFWTQWERLAGLERQLLLALPDGSEHSSMLLPLLLDALGSVQQARTAGQ
jgi:hypothetical protein